MKLRPIEPLEWPPSDPKTEAAIGRFLVARGTLEGELTEAIGDILYLGRTQAESVTANLGTKSKVEIFLSSFHHESSLFPGPLLDEVNKLGHDTAAAAGTYRNFVAHGQPVYITFDGDEFSNSEWTWLKSSARKGGVKHSFSAFTPHVFDKHAEKIRTLVGRWHELRLAMRSGVETLYHIRTHDED